MRHDGHGGFRIEGRGEAAGEAAGVYGGTFSPAFPPFAKRNPFYLPGEDPTATAKSAPTEKTAPGAKADKEQAAKEFFSGLVLNATCLLDEKQSAIINGQVYKRKDALKTHNPDIPPFVVAQILPYEVQLECRGKILSLRYPDVYAGREPPKSMNPSASNADHASKKGPKNKPAAPKSLSADKTKP